MPEKDILIVDGEAGIRELFRATVQDNGYLADIAGTAAEALKHLEEHRYQLVLVEWRLPDGDGTVRGQHLAMLSEQDTFAPFLGSQPDAEHEANRPNPPFGITSLLTL